MHVSIDFVNKHNPVFHPIEQKRYQIKEPLGSV